MRPTGVIHDPSQGTLGKGVAKSMVCNDHSATVGMTIDAMTAPVLVGMKPSCLKALTSLRAVIPLGNGVT